MSLNTCLNLHFTKGLGNISFGKLMEQYGNADDALNASTTEWKSIGIRDGLQLLAKKTQTKKIKQVYDWLEQSPLNHVVSYDCHNYPKKLKQLADPPAILYARGNITILKKTNMAIVGSRHASPMGLKTAHYFASQLAQHNISIGSGLALGIDAASHMGALSVEGTTLAYMGTGVDVIYPKQHTELAQKMIENNGLVLSEFPLGTQPKAGNFPPRNRLIAGTSDLGVLIVESKAKGGSMITARLANEQGKNVFAIPGSIHNLLSEGCHRLIQNGAKLVCTVKDILEESNIEWQIKKLPNNANKTEQIITYNLNNEQIELVKVMQYEVMRIEEIAKLSKIPVHKVQQLLFDMQIQGEVESLSGNRWQKI